MSRKLIIAGNWKMNHTSGAAAELVSALTQSLADVDSVDVVVCPPMLSLDAALQAAQGSAIGVGSQNIHWAASGAFTGEVSADMLNDAGVAYVIIGHSERRQYFGETDTTVNQRLRAALDGGLIPIVCVGETLAQRESGDTESVVGTQLRDSLAGLSSEEMQKTIVAYEPVWAIGTGVTASPEQAQDVHAFIRALLADLHGQAIADVVRIQYGGSVKPGNSADLMGQADIDGALVGGASLKADDFTALIKNAIA
jgi:triosephosphate isomerase